MLFSMTVTFEWRGAVRNEEINLLHAEGFDHEYGEDDWTGLLSRLSLGWVTARDDQGLVGFVNVIWDGRLHAFIEDTLVAHRARRQGIGKRLVRPPEEFLLRCMWFPSHQCWTHPTALAGGGPSGKRQEVGRHLLAAGSLNRTWPPAPMPPDRGLSPAAEGRALALAVP